MNFKIVLFVAMLSMLATVNALRLSTSENRIANENTNSNSLEVEWCKGKPQYAIALFGGVSRMAADTHGQGANAFNAPGEFVNIGVVANAINHHIISPNGGQDNVKVFIHTWATALEEKMRKIHTPVSATFEDQEDQKQNFIAHLGSDDQAHHGGYSSWSGTAASFSMQKSLELVQKYEKDCGHTFDKILLYRPDVLLWGRNMTFAEYDGSRVYANHHDDKGTGDFHWVMNSENARKFKPFDSINPQATPYFGWIRDYIKSSVTPGDIAADQFRPCHEQEVLRQIRQCQDKFDNGINQGTFDYLGLTKEDALELGLHS